MLFITILHTFYIYFIRLSVYFERAVCIGGGEGVSL